MANKPLDKGKPIQPATGGQKVKATKIRAALAAGHEVSLADLVWFESYEAAHGGADVGASSSRKRVEKTEVIEEDQRAVGTGGAAHAAVGLFYATKAEGERLDKLTVNAVEALKAAVDVYRQVSEDMRKDRIEDRKAVRELTSSIREHYLGRIKAEGRLLKKLNEKADDDGDPMQAVLAAMLPAIAQKLGVSIVEDGGAAPKNGAAKK